MSILGIILTASLAQNVVFVHFLGLWPFHAAVRSPVRSVVISVVVTIALLWVSVVYWAVYQWILGPLNLYVLETLTMVTIMGFTVIAGIRLGGRWFPYRRRTVLQFLPVGVVNMTVFVVAMGLVQSVQTLTQVVAGAIAAGLGLFIALVPIAAVKVRFSGAHVPAVLRGDVSVYLATAFMAFAIQQIDQLLQSIAVPLF